MPLHIVCFWYPLGVHQYLFLYISYQIYVVYRTFVYFAYIQCFLYKVWSFERSFCDFKNFVQTIIFLISCSSVSFSSRNLQFLPVSGILPEILLGVFLLAKTSNCEVYSVFPPVCSVQRNTARSAAWKNRTIQRYFQLSFMTWPARLLIWTFWSFVCFFSV